MTLQISESTFWPKYAGWWIQIFCRVTVPPITWDLLVGMVFLQRNRYHGYGSKSVPVVAPIRKKFMVMEGLPDKFPSCYEPLPLPGT